MTRRASIPYAQREVRAVHVPGAISVEHPVAGFYRMRFRAGGVWTGIHIFYGPPLDPITGEEMDRGHRWQAVADDGEVVENFDQVWPACGGDRITADQFRELRERRAWARQHAPRSAYADKRKRVAPLSLETPMLF